MYSLFSYFFPPHFIFYPRKVVEDIDIESGSMPNRTRGKIKKKKDNRSEREPFAKVST